ncbi:hypothetical protein [Flagellimonas allohymeniacidonis]|uniref:Cohesin domain-containing protein n=1 Tax=Flagellimonas allohymeniacidonis TaxID=2517819 RepID=A0A4Q8QB93_9FLAO|nr:hypothetical protein [Allomuricauda hymeniacidonis]TAI47605.1 hypothetical protein EW142_13150 [Allomuricauda hymeniacidonis]
MKAPFTWILILALILSSCTSDEDNSENQTINPKSVTDCDLTIEANTLISICVDGTDLASPNEVITFASKFFSKGDVVSNSQFLWAIESGSMQILTVENTFDGTVAKSVATIQFNSDYSGGGLITVRAENNRGIGTIEHGIELGSNQ